MKTRPVFSADPILRFFGQMYQWPVPIPCKVQRIVPGAGDAHGKVFTPGRDVSNGVESLLVENEYEVVVRLAILKDLSAPHIADPSGRYPFGLTLLLIITLDNFSERSEKF